MPRRPPLRSLALTCSVVLATAACGGAPVAPAATSAVTTTVTTASATPPTTTTPPPSPTPATTTTPPAVPTTTTGPVVPAGRVVVLDPGHNGGNAAHPEEINKPVPAGRGQVKACNTTGTATGAGYPEHAFTWDLAQRVRALLTARGVRVVLTRPDDTGVGPCVDRRAAIGNEAAADAVVSLHADGSTAAGARGFHIAHSSPPLNAAQGAPSLELAGDLRDALVGAGFPTSTYIGTAGLSPRNDLAGLNLATRPSALIECGNMRDPAEAATLSSPDGRQRYAEGIANGILGFLG
ncbi:N-acetylmuramoyl-L-alanine amidase [Actinokineospora spheciospongiae]|uniref:N-acetylmuramoyl-L-alanine amidase n=1 Tax=Actinokineospora spheciospongiae TaxID=909613 RepID=UPI001F3ACC38|nr:N-acetylmuramoyl-L-alanine amidase [Actinokineospora spheciospongiae]